MPALRSVDQAVQGGPVPTRHRRRGAVFAVSAVLVLVLVLLAVAWSLRQPESAPPVLYNTNEPGVPEGTRLVVHEGDIVVTKQGTILDGLDIHGFVIIKAPDVTIMNSVVRGRATEKGVSLVSNYKSGLPFTIVDSELVGGVPSPWINGVMGSNFELRGVLIHRVVDAVHITGDNVLVEDSRLEANLHFSVDPNQGGEASHDDSIQVQAGNNIRIRNNHISGPHNAVLQITQDLGPVSNLSFLRNTADGGFCSVNVSEKGRGPIQGLVIEDNRFGRGTAQPDCAIIAPPTTRIQMKGNVYTDGTEVAVRRGR
jgi:hypothetical protein